MTRGRGRPRKPEAEKVRYRSVTARLHPDEFAAFTELCNRRDVKVHAEIVRLIRKELES